MMGENQRQDYDEVINIARSAKTHEPKKTNNTTTKQKQKHQTDRFSGVYLPRFNALRLIAVCLLVLIEFGLGFVPYFEVVQVFLNFAPGLLFALYGFLVLQDGADLDKHIKRVLLAFVIVFVVYGLLTAGYNFITTGDALSSISKRSIFNFAVLNIWSNMFCANIWFLQSALYALVILWLLRKLKRFDWLLCIVLFVIAIIIGELAGVFGFSVLGYNYIPGNFFTRAIPYMLLGRLIRTNRGNIRGFFEKGKHRVLAVFLLGLALAVAEFLALGFSGKLVYSNHFIGFILMVLALCAYGSLPTPESTFFGKGGYATTIYKGMFYAYNPLGYILLLVAGIVSMSAGVYYVYSGMVGLIVLVLSFCIFLLYAFLRKKHRDKREHKKRLEQTQDMQPMGDMLRHSVEEQMKAQHIDDQNADEHPKNSN